jgi:hypothetical protein
MIGLYNIYWPGPSNEGLGQYYLATSTITQKVELTTYTRLIHKELRAYNNIMRGLIYSLGFELIDRDYYGEVRLVWQRVIKRVEDYSGKLRKGKGLYRGIV